MQIRELYQKIKIPPNLERHMFQVTAVGEFIATHWQDEKLNISLLKKSLLVHDVGNLVKFRRPFLGELEQNAKHWESAQEEMVELYGKDAHEVTLHLLKRYEVDLSVYRFVQDLSQRQLVLSPFSNVSWELLIAELADLSVSPEGIVGVEERVKDIQTRYAETFHQGVLEYARALREKIQERVSIDLRILPKDLVVQSHLYESEIVS